MKLQINTAGAWRDVVKFEPHQLRHVQAATVPLAREVGDRATWRITEDARSAIAYLEAPSFHWRWARRNA